MRFRRLLPRINPGAGPQRPRPSKHSKPLSAPTYWHLIGEYIEVESGKLNERPQLAAAMAQCRLTGATLVISKLVRLSRDAHFLLGLEKAGLDFVAADMPNASRLTVGIMAVIALEERRMISERTKAALAAARARGKALGGWRPVSERA